ncbi:MAG: hypothetical protein J7578_00240, partial [Chitinophagaceae bacterium]|nr:hypothetical protein [Chitinophagaceae bacterium]
MRVISLVLLCLLSAFAATAQNANWQSDLRFLQQTIHRDYPFLFKKISAAAFDATADSLFAAMPRMQEHECLAGLTRIVASIKYGHTALPWRDSKVKYHMTPMNFYWFNDGLYVEGTTKANAAILGARILKVEGKPIAKVLQAIKPLVPAENDQFFKSRGPDYLGIPEALHAQGITPTLKSSILYTFGKNGKTFEIAIPAIDAFQLPRFYGFTKPEKDWLTARDTSFTPLYLKNQDRIYYYEYLPDSKTVYVRHSQIQDEPEMPIALFYKNLYSFIEKNDVARLILDVRLNGGGNNYLLKPIITGLIETPKINKPGKFFVIIGRRTFSACQNLVNEFSNYTNAIFVGEPTSENINFYGDNNRITLPNTQTQVLLSFAWWQDKPQWENATWLAPQVAADMSFSDYQHNIDPSLNACLAMNETNAITDPMQKLKTLFFMGKMDEVEKETKRMVNDPMYR